jgi:hypothetical protein
VFSDFLPEACHHCALFPALKVGHVCGHPSVDRHAFEELTRAAFKPRHLRVISGEVMSDTAGMVLAVVAVVSSGWCPVCRSGSSLQV